jgi:hypothetical protein
VAGVINEDILICSPCPPGKYTQDLDQTTCSTCESGKYAPKFQHRACDVCPAGKFTPAGMVNHAECTLCVAGKFSAVDAHTCTGCPAGKYGETPGMAYASACHTCEIGHYNVGTSNTGCTKCPTGTYAENLGSSTCTTCPTGKYQFDAGEKACLTCPRHSVPDDTSSSCVSEFVTCGSSLTCTWTAGSPVKVIHNSNFDGGDYHCARVGRYDSDYSGTSCVCKCKRDVKATIWQPYMTWKSKEDAGVVQPEAHSANADLLDYHPTRNPPYAGFSV